MSWLRFVRPHHSKLPLPGPRPKHVHPWLGREVTFPGINYSNGGKPLVVVAANRDYVAVRHPGGTVWSGIGCDRAPINVHVMVFRIVGFPDPESWKDCQVEDAIDVPVRIPKESKS